MVLLHALALVSSARPLHLLAITLDHGLREAARDEVQLVSAFCKKLGVPCVQGQLGLSPGGNLQERARRARYDALFRLTDEHLGPEAFLATAHHADDRAETVLLRLLRGTSLEGLAVLPARAGRLLRPLVEARRGAVDLHVERHAVPFVDDPSNLDPHYLRVRVRHELVPLLEELSPGATSHLLALAEEAMDLPTPLGLNREQRLQLRRALAQPGSALDLPLPGGLRLTRSKAKTDEN